MPAQHTPSTLFDDEEAALRVECHSGRPFKPSHKHGSSTVRRDADNCARLAVGDDHGAVAVHGDADGI